MTAAFLRLAGRDLETAIEADDCDPLLFATPGNLMELLRAEKPLIRGRYAYKDAGNPTLDERLR